MRLEIKKSKNFTPSHSLNLFKMTNFFLHKLLLNIIFFGILKFINLLFSGIWNFGYFHFSGVFCFSNYFFGGMLTHSRFWKFAKIISSLFTRPQTPTSFKKFPVSPRSLNLFLSSGKQLWGSFRNRKWNLFYHYP